MIFTEEDKAFIKFMYPIIDYGLRRVMREFPGKTRNTFGWDNLITKLLNVQAHAWSSISPTVRKPNERRDRLFGLVN